MGYREIFSHMGGYNMVVIQIATNYTSTNINIVRMEPSARYKEISFSQEYMFFFLSECTSMFLKNMYNKL